MFFNGIGISRKGEMCKVTQKWTAKINARRYANVDKV
jgi:hypothetical protein